MEKFLLSLKKNFRRQLVIAFCLVIFLAEKAMAGVDPPVVQVLDGSLGQLNIGDSAMVEDAKFFDPGYSSVLLTPYPLRNVISLEVIEDKPLVIQSDFEVTIRLGIYYTTNTNATGYEERNFTVRYKAGAPYEQKHVYIFSNCTRVTIKVDTMTKDVGWNAFGVVKVVNQLQSLPNYTWNCSGNVIEEINDSAWAANTDKDELPVYWAPVIGADEYDLEWTYIDSSALASGRYGDPGDPDATLIFDNNASRVTIKGTLYAIPLIYDNKGYLFFRVRPVQWQAGGGRNEANWSSDYAPDGLGKFNYNGHERPLNWQATTTYAEDGKRKIVIQYFDGSLRGRQTVTKDNSTNTTIVAESFYDYQGRPVIQVLPAPTMNSILKYNQSFNVGLNSNIYDKFNYDTLGNPELFCNSGAAAMDTISGAAKYYSPNNELVDSNFHQYIPNAQGFPFTEVEYTQDNTGRISRQSGVGNEFRISSGHETKYFYTTADRDELYALFGTEVGDESHYFKTAVRDANGQYSISYTDMHGRTIATALAGATPDSIRLDTLASYVSATRTERLSNPEATVITGLVMENKKSLLVTKAGMHTFNYQLSPRTLALEDCDSTQICYDCLYDLRITITDDCNNQKLPDGVPFDTLVRNFSIGSIDTTCEDTTGFSFTFHKYLVEGNYEITKKLSISRSAMDYYRDSIFMKRNACQNLDSFLVEQRQRLAAVLQCQHTCETCTDSLGTWTQFWERYRRVTGVKDVDTAEYKNMAWVAYNAAIEECAQLCDSVSESNDVRRAMLMDMTPSSGQYANIVNDSSVYSVFFARADGNTPDTAAPYQQVSNYLDQDGNPDKVFDEASGTLVTPDQLSPEAFVQKFKPSWAQALLPYHPEYCKLVWYDTLRASHEWDRRFAAVDSWREAKEKGYLNPTNNTTTTPFTYFTGTSPDVDPMSTYSNDFKTQLENSLTEYRESSATPFDISMWSVAMVTVKCDDPTGVVSCFGQYFQPQYAFDTTYSCDGELDMAWRAFRQMYLDVKRNIQNQWLAEQCDDSPGAPTLMAAGHQPHFSDATELLTANNFTLPTDTVGITQNYQQQINNYYTSNCTSYATQWWKQLAPCNFSEDDSARIVSRLIKICREGSDASHPYGSSSIKPTSSYDWESFDEFLHYYCDSVGKQYNENCNAFFIPAPKPYNNQSVYSNKPIYQSPDSCECSQIAAYYEKYQESEGYSSFGAFMQDVYQTSIDTTSLAILMGYCGIGGVLTPFCPVLSTPIYLPPAFQCGTGDVCITCSQFDVLVTQFRDSFPDVHPSSGEFAIGDSVQISHNRFFADFMNYHTGFSKEAADYLGFLESCNISLFDLQCDTIANLVDQVNEFFETPHYDATGCDTTFWKINYGGNNWTVGTTFGSLLNNGYAYIPDTVSHPPVVTGTRMDWDNYNMYCIPSGNFSIEVRIKIPDSTKFASAFSIFELILSTARESDNVINVAFVNHIKKTYPGYNYSNYVEYDTDTLTHFNDFKTIRCDFRGDTLRTYYEGILLYQHLYPRPKQVIGYLTLQPRSFHMSVDYIKMTRPDGSVIFNEDFDSCNATTYMAAERVPPSSLARTKLRQIINAHYGSNFSFLQVDSILIKHCGIAPLILPTCLMNCDSLTQYYNEFVATISQYAETCGSNELCYEQRLADYVNEKTGHSFTVYEILGFYKLCGINVNLMSPPITLCGRAEPVFAMRPMDPIDNCIDSTFFIQSVAQELYKVYIDSLKNRFDSAYAAKCLQAYKFENFTVRHEVSEFHHTLYYYDQAGNLIKTVPPAGVHANYDSLWLDSVHTARLAGLYKVPTHSLVTQYRYNTLNQVVAQKSPDGGKTEFWYDRLGRLVLSRNAKQRVASSSERHFYSFTRYDHLGRITQVGQLRDTSITSAVSDAFTRNESALQNWFTQRDRYRHDLTQTVYDTAYLPYYALGMQQRNLRNRVSFVTLRSDTIGMSTAFHNGIFYTYDIAGNVDTLLNDYGPTTDASVQNMMNVNGNRRKKIVYNYDLISGKVNTVAYQRGYTDQFFQRYAYDAENRLILAESSRDSVVWETEATYQYYKHGPLARMVLGGQQVQGIDYAYTLQGWLKGINSTGGTSTHDMGGDGKSGYANQYTATDAIGVSLNYFAGDYTPISATMPFPGYSGYLSSLDNAYKPLYNGNISSTSIYNRRLGDVEAPGGSLLFYNYAYDQLNRLTGMDVYHDFNRGSNHWMDMEIATDSMMKEKISYDANGNILTYRRKAATGPLMDSLHYKYYPGTNQLRQITDSVPDGNFPGAGIIYDIDGQGNADNYKYDSIGNLIQDVKEQIDTIKWNVYGKITEIKRASSGSVPITTIKYFYDALGNRIGKVFDLGSQNRYTWYVRDAQGNVLSIYDAIYVGGHTLPDLDVTQVEQYRYGSSRLGFLASNQPVDNNEAGPATMEYYNGEQLSRGKRFYELTNHLGNVLATITDKKFGVTSGGSLNDYYNPEIVSATDYYPFGMAARVTVNLSNYTRFGFNGKEFDWEVKAWQNQYDYGTRMYDPRIGRFLSVDPLQTQFSDLTPYQFAGNTPIQAVDLDGLEPKGFMINWEWQGNEVPTNQGYSVEDIYDHATKRYWTIMRYPNTENFFYWETKYENAHNLFVPHNTSLNKNAEGLWTGKFKEFIPRKFSDDKSLYVAALGMLSVPFIAVYGKAILVWLGKELLEEAAGVPIPDSPVDLWKYELKRKAREEAAKQMLHKIDDNAVDLLKKYDCSNNPGLDCSEIADEFASSFKGGRVIEITAKDKNLLLKQEGYYDGYLYHQVYVKDGFVYDPRFSKDPIKYDDYMKQIEKDNPNGIEIKEIKKSDNK